MRGTHVGPTSHQGAPWGGGHAPWACGPLVYPPDVFSVPKILKYSIKIILNFQGILRTFIFSSFFYCTDKIENRKIVAFLLN